MQYQLYVHNNGPAKVTNFTLYYKPDICIICIISYARVDFDSIMSVRCHVVQINLIC